MHTLLSDARPSEHQRLQDYARLTHDIHVPYTDRIALRIGLWLLLSGARRAQARTDQSARDRRALARDTYARHERQAAFVRAGMLSHYR